ECPGGEGRTATMREKSAAECRSGDLPRSRRGRAEHAAASAQLYRYRSTARAEQNRGKWRPASSRSARPGASVRNPGIRVPTDGAPDEPAIHAESDRTRVETAGNTLPPRADRNPRHR